MNPMQNKSTRAREHDWRVSPAEARSRQEHLRSFWEGADRLGTIRTVAGLDAAFLLTESQALSTERMRPNRANRAIGGVVVYRFPELEVLERATALLPLEFPYVPGLLSFREAPVLLAAIRKLKALPDLLVCDGHGYAHPRRFGLACHLGVWLDCPAIGCAKSLLLGTHGELPREARSWTELRDEKAGGERIGAVLRTRTGVQPVYVSQGHRVSLETAVRLAFQLTDGLRIPKPTREADQLVREARRALSGER